MNIKKKIICHFDPEVVEQPIISVLSKEYDLYCNILKAKIDLRKVGYLIMEIRGEEKKISGWNGVSKTFKCTSRRSFQ